MHYLWSLFFKLRMDIFLDNTRRLFDTLKSLSWWSRLFGWGQVKSQLIEANGELQKLNATATTIKAENTRLENSLSIERVALKMCRMVLIG